MFAAESISSESRLPDVHSPRPAGPERRISGRFAEEKMICSATGREKEIAFPEAVNKDD